MTIELVPPAIQRGSLSAKVDWTAGRIRASGHLTALGADLLSGAADVLRGAGHQRVVVDLREVRSADDAGLEGLAGLQRRFAAAGAEVLVERLPPVS